MNKLWGERKLGDFCLDHSMITNLPVEILHAFFCGLIVVRAESEFASMQIKYTALSYVFEVVPEGHNPPKYEVEIKRSYNPDGSWSVVDLHFKETI